MNNRHRSPGAGTRVKALCALFSGQNIRPLKPLINSQTLHTVIDILAIIVGFALIAFRRPFARMVIDSQNKAWGFKFGARDKRVSEFVSVVVGLGFVVLGLLSL